MRAFSFYFRDSKVSVSYDRGDSAELIWIASLQIRGRVIAIDGTAGAVSADPEAEITRSVIKSLEWALATAKS